MNLDGGTKAALRNALIAAFPTWGELKILVDDRLSEQLQNISSEVKPVPQVAHDLINWAQSRGRVTELVIGASAENPGNPELKAFADQFRFAAGAGGELERIVLPAVTFENVGQWLNKLARLRRAVARFEPQPFALSKADYGTGFLVAPDLLMTNWHVVEKNLSGLNDPKKVVVRFDCELDAGGAQTPGRVCSLADVWDCGHRDMGTGLDYALVRLKEAPAEDVITGAKRGFIKLDGKHRPGVKEPLMILQHPDAMPLKLSIGTVESIDANGKRVSYTANTLGGSSGSPCFNTALEPVALHHIGDGGKNLNHGVRLDAIYNDLQSRGLGGQLG
jgi:Trypsin-like peptidase domain/Effector-associated domain 1